MTITKYDGFLDALRKREIYGNVSYEVMDENGTTVIVTGVYVICDGGYMKDSFLIDPYNFRSSRSIIYWSEWLESLRKDVECLFGILKSRWRILRNPVAFHSIEDIENIMYCCCILHNLLISADGIDIAWEDDVAWDTLDPDAEADGDEIVPNVVEVVDNVVELHAAELPVEHHQISQVNSSSMRFYEKKKSICHDINCTNPIRL
jgi:Plant transposon protein